ncbi:site-specific tyrosine recombinase XerC [Pirellula sp. SH-Sr6A]|nr:site-specific tyrosine recombinase XerC [Pirellula sp. SH-Sr6A]
MLLATVVDQVAMECDLALVTVKQYELAVKRFSEFLGKQATKDDLTTENLNGFVCSLQKFLTGTTARNYRVSITRLWNHLTEFYGLEPYNVRRLRRPKIEEKPVYAWSAQQVQQLMQGCENLIGIMRCGAREYEFMKAWLLLGYDTGLRPIDLRGIEWDDLDFESRRFAIVQHKTGIAHHGMMRPQTIVALEILQQRLPNSTKVFPLSKGGVRRLELALYKEAATFGFKRRRGQGIGTLRKTHATGVYTLAGEHAAAESLGHVGGVRTARKSYIDHRAVQKGRLPPEF